MNNVRKQSFLSLLILLIYNNVSAQMNWNFTTTASSSGSISNVTAGSLTQVNNDGSTTFINAGSPASSSYAGASGANNGNISAKTGSINTSTSSYVQLVLTPASNYSLSFSGISWGNYSVSTSGPSLVSVYTSADNYAAPICTTSVLQNSAWSLVAPSFSQLVLKNGEALTIRIYASGGSGSTPAAGTANWRIDDLKITAKAMPIIETVHMSMKYASSPAAATPWNNITGLNTNNLNNSAGTSTSVGLEFLAGSWSNTGNEGRITGNNSGVYPDNVIRDYYWCGNYGAPDSVSANIKGLDTSARYNVTLFGSSKWNGVANNGTTIYTINSVPKSLYVDSNYLNTVSFNGVKPNSSGIIQFRISKGPFAPYALVNAVVLEKLYDSAAIPVASWNYGGNTVGSEQKIGTSDSVDFPVITNNIERLKVTATGNVKMYGSLSAGSGSTASGTSSISLGSSSTSSGNNSVAIGEQAKAIGVKSVAIGGSAFGSYTQALKTNSIAISGYSSIADADASIVIGSQSRTKANYSTALGYGLVAQSAGSTVIGVYNDTATAGSLTTFDTNTRVLQIGAGSPSARKNAMTVMSNANIGIGTNLPDSVLHLKGGFKYEHPTAGAGKVLTSDANGGASWQTPGGGQWTSFGINTYHTNTLGTVFIGMTNIADSSYRLFVEKGIRTRKVKVDINNWPDYVFQPEYQLRSIPDVEKYIKVNGHLPDVPSAAEIEKEGASLGDNQAILLKKIEELTLYIIEMNKKIEALEEQNVQLKKAIDKR